MEVGILHSAASRIEQIHTGLCGGQLLRGDKGYDVARKMYNAIIDHQPAVIARCAGVVDVIEAVNILALNTGQALSTKQG